MTRETQTTDHLCAFEGNLISVKPIASRGVYVFVVEVPEEYANECLRRIGGLPLAKQSHRVAVARIADAI